MTVTKNALQIALALVVVASLHGSSQVYGQNRSMLKTDAVEYLFPEQVTVAAGKASPVTLHFRIASGLHINSHTPSEDYLIPTTFSIPDGAGVRLDKAEYPAGILITLPADPKTKLSVYSGDFSVQTRIVSLPGNHLIEARLHYQACNETQCLPPKTIPVAIDVIGK